MNRRNMAVPGNVEIIVERLCAALTPRAEVLDAYLFGSQARGDAKPRSDVDVAVYIDESLAQPGPFGYRADVITDCMAALGRNDVDLLLLNQAPPVLYYRVLRDGRRLIARDVAATTTREGRALSRYCDYVPQLAKIDAGWRARSAS